MKPAFYPLPGYENQQDMDISKWDDPILSYCAGYYEGQARVGPQTHREFYRRWADLTRAEMLARKLAQ